jgi:Tol biopolymer transport system component
MTIKDWLFTWSPTDGKIAYWHFSGADQVCEQNSIDNIHDLAWMNAAGGTQTIVKANVTYRLSAWLPNGSGLVAVNDYNAWYRVSLLDGSAISLGVTATRLDVSPDGTKVAFLNGGYLYVRNLAGGISKNLGAATDFAWRPDSAALAVSSGTLRLVNATTGSGTVVFAFATKSPSWSPRPHEAGLHQVVRRRHLRHRRERGAGDGDPRHHKRDARLLAAVGPNQRALGLNRPRS